MMGYAGLGEVESIYAARDLVARKRSQFNTTLVLGGVVLLGSAGYYIHKNKR